ncbi:tetratricopeptide repeat protein [Streptomyces sp. NPDC047081]|uniref:tetratricopeptide repeat protein n=1 Tax=Streptomyces sp. NPDC047081 TaxID=3154706 RepID=UPI0034112CA0
MGFTGRSAELDRLLPHLAPSENDTAALPLLIFAVTGMGGIGKTALAVEAAHRAIGSGWFPGGTLFVDLRGYDDDPATADQAVLALLDALGIRDRDLPTTTERQYDAYRALLAERHDRMLLVLDNASDPSQYLPLLPGTDRHRVLITSRDRPDTLAVRLIDLGTLDPDDSVALVARALHYTDERDDRPEREPEALRELADLCGHLPLALQIAAAMLRRRRQRDISSLVTEIRDTGDPTLFLDGGSGSTDQYGRSLALRPILDVSYHRLSREQARLLRLLALAPGTDTGTEAVAALADLDPPTAISLLESLAAVGLISAAAAAGAIRWRLHDLVRAFGADVVAANTDLQEEGETARERLLDFYCGRVQEADAHIGRRWRDNSRPTVFKSLAEALAWLDQERVGLTAAVPWASDTHAVNLALHLMEYSLNWRRYFDDWIIISSAAHEAAGRLGDRTAEASILNSLGFALRRRERMAEAMDAHLRARELWETSQSPGSVASAWHNIGQARHELGQLPEAAEALSLALDLHRASGHVAGEAAALISLGSVREQAGQLTEAIDAYTRSRDLHHALGDLAGEALAWSFLGWALHIASRTHEGINASTTALGKFLDIGDWADAADAAFDLARMYHSVGNTPEARTHYLQAADAYTRSNSPADAARAQSAAHTLT